MEAYELPFFDPEDEAELRAEVAHAGADTSLEGSQASADVLESPTSRESEDAACPLVTRLNPVSYNGASSGDRCGSLDKNFDQAGGALSLV